MAVVEDQASDQSQTKMVDSNGTHTKAPGTNNNSRPEMLTDHHQRLNSNREMRELEEMFSKLNPMAQEFVPPSIVQNFQIMNNVSAAYFAANSTPFIMPMPFSPISPKNGFLNGNGASGGRTKNFGQGKRRMGGGRSTIAQREDVVRRTVYVSDIDHSVTEEMLAGLFLHCGQVVDCRICGDPHSVLRFAFVEFTDEEGALAALSLSGTVLGYYPVKVLPSKTAIVPVNPTFLPRNDDEREMCARTVYCTNIDKKVTQDDVKRFFETVCGEVYRLRMLGDYNHPTRIAFVEFVLADSAIAALNCSGVVLGSTPIRVSPSKTPVRPRAAPRAMPH
ncbi:RNA splicing factor [Lithospermum erythrorhizon]|uniref:RNA splicing factor n=1 Tax=Lithospermum erythrorhizon TaxID=34254 RepID=A0AAV3NUJ4_LITER